MLVRFTHYGGDFHRKAAGDEKHKFEVAEMSEIRQKKQTTKPRYLGMGTNEHRLKGQSIGREQELKWLELSKEKK